MAILRWILALPLIVGAVLFALANPDKVAISWSPFSASIELPLYFVSLAFLGGGFLIGIFVAWIGMSHTRTERRHYKKEVKKLEKDVNAANERIMEILAQKKDDNYALAKNTLDEDNDTF